MGERFEIHKRGGLYEVWYLDEYGMSILSRVKTLSEAKKRLDYHKKRRKRGWLLREDESVWGKLKKVV